MGNFGGEADKHESSDSEGGSRRAPNQRDKSASMCPGSEIVQETVGRPASHLAGRTGS